MKSITAIVALMVLSAISLKAQLVVSYEYDDAGNRIKRKVIELSTKTAQPEDSISPVVDEFGAKKVLIFPNPTKGMLTVRIVNVDSDTQNFFTLYNTSGVPLFNGQMQGSGDYPIDMESNSAGVYILVLVSGKDRTSYKVIKK